MKHTQGTWNHSDGSIYSESTEHGADIATVNTTSAHFTDEEAEANGNLLAAAPELLEALQVIKNVLTGWDHKDGKYANLIFYAESTINKATL